MLTHKLLVVGLHSHGQTDKEKSTSVGHYQFGNDRDSYNAVLSYPPFVRVLLEKTRRLPACSSLHSQRMSLILSSQDATFPPFCLHHCLSPTYKRRRGVLREARQRIISLFFSYSVSFCLHNKKAISFLTNHAS